MRPHILTPLFADLKDLQGIGPRLQKLLKRLLAPQARQGDAKIVDLLFHFPLSLIDRRARPTIAQAVPGQIATMAVEVAEHRPPPRGQRRVPYRVICSDDTGSLELVFFHAKAAYLEKQLPVGETRIVSGRVEDYGGRLQMPHPDHILSEADLDELPLLEPVYPLTAGLSGKVARKAAAQAVARLPKLPEWQDPAWLARQHWPSFQDAVCAAHAPQSEDDLLPSSPAHRRLAFDELLANQLALALVRQRLHKTTGRALRGDGTLRARIGEALPFELTPSQAQVMGEIEADMAEPTRMLRLLQGDVGSGKTVVALLAMAVAIEAGAQAALMAPTELLARQHLKTLMEIAEPTGIRVALLTSREKGKARSEILDALARGEIDILIGTHALFQEGVDFKDLAVAVIDEQHRFGVHQRLALQAKSGAGAIDVLVMTATPIPRTLLLTHYGDMEVSKLLEKPAGRKPVATRAMPIDRLNEILDRLEAALATGAQAYWVCPLVEESDVLDATAAEERFAALKARFGDRVALVHGQMSGSDKDAAMQAFADGKVSILVATTVIEVGVDVPNATIMVIEHAERFGLAQLHQLRGRVGRGSSQSACILMYKPPLSETARARLNALRESEDGFKIAEDDLRLRGGGEVLGTRQSGLPEFRVASLPRDDDLLSAARDDARLILANDADLSGARGQTLRVLLYLFERDEAIRLLKAG
ncbi:MAG: ATP-dependent DNA helicase RecG [Hyphomicrobiaceae bacterium]|nr:ATP-dependent DNA helicase RecG [Hyphomicrobiaceae bacterium]